MNNHEFSSAPSAIYIIIICKYRKRQHKIKNETTKSNNTYKIVQIFKSIVLNLISCVVIHRKSGVPNH